mmetsp:Transcript_681/g.1778  ORF Transcript_681/g.1778 Transcript_681/m.1778 type:complete len:302 (+) Transcript_681:549-1454(+)
MVCPSRVGVAPTHAAPWCIRRHKPEGVGVREALHVVALRVSGHPVHWHDGVGIILGGFRLCALKEVIQAVVCPLICIEGNARPHLREEHGRQLVEIEGVLGESLHITGVNQDKAGEALLCPGRRNEISEVGHNNRLLREMMDGLDEKVHLRPDLVVRGVQGHEAHEGLRQPTISASKPLVHLDGSRVHEEFRQGAKAGRAERRQRLLQVPVGLAARLLAPLLHVRACGQWSGALMAPRKHHPFGHGFGTLQRDALPRHGLEQRRVGLGISVVRDAGADEASLADVCRGEGVLGSLKMHVLL